uniref:Uncharacterized protein n=1 Tax=Dunaliella tertiolecta TaxID=3047 RepID=A0A7S3QTU3_DUNTE
MLLLTALPASFPPSSPPSSTLLSPSSQEHGSRAGLACASDSCCKPHRPCIQGLTFSGLDLPELPLYLSTLLQLPSRCSHLNSFSLQHTPLSCPLDCTEPTLLDQLLRQLYAFEGRPVPHITLLAQQVGDHEMRLSANILVTQKVGVGGKH